MNTKCNLCGETKLSKRPGKVRDNDSLEILECENCGLVFMSSFDYIDDNFYEDAKMHHDEKDIDIDAWIEETAFDDERRFSKYKEVIKDKNILDFGCGCGGFLLKAKTQSNISIGVELEKRLKPYFEKNDLNVFSDIKDVSYKFDYIFMFHVLEHIKTPLDILETLKDFLKPDGKLIIEVPNSDDALLILYKNKAFSEFTYWSPHLYLYNEKTLSRLLQQAGYKTECIEQEQRYSLANHLYWLAQEKPGGHKVWSFLDTDELNAQYRNVLAKEKKCDTIEGTFTK